MAVVLIIEDEAVLRASMARGISKLSGIVTIEAGTLTEALSHLDEQPPDLIFSDLDLPDRSGIEILGELGKRGWKIPVVFISAYLKAYAPQIPRHAAVEVRDKPVSLEELRQIVVNKVGVAKQQVADPPFSAVDFVQLACLGRHSVTIDMSQNGTPVGNIQVFHGTVWNARDPLGHGEDAFRRLLFGREFRVTCRTLVESPQERNIHLGWETLLMEAARIHDEMKEAGALQRELDDLEQATLDPGETVPEPVPPPQALLTEDAFETAWETGINALLNKEYQAALRAFLLADQIQPGNRRVEANVKRLHEMGIVVESPPTLTS